MEKKYWVPGLERGRNILDLVARRPAELRLIDICRELDLNKSSAFSLLNTLEKLQFVQKERGDTYRLGPWLGILGAAYFSQFNLLESFHNEAKSSVQEIHETLQLGMLDKTEVLYLAKEETETPHVVSNPGMRYPAHTTGLGKVQLAQYDATSLRALYEGQTLDPRTPYTITDIERLWDELQEVARQGYAIDQQEAVEGFFCVAAPVYNHTGRIIAGTSVSMTKDHWLAKQETAIQEVVGLAQRISWQAGYRPKQEN